jgi:rSAM/selenodomain-associated transferase 1
VKTRLAAQIGDAAALRVYRRLAEQALGAARAAPGGPRIAVHFTPAGSARAVRGWLGEGVEYHPQGEGDLGARMRSAFQAAFARGSARVLAIGSDLPEISPALLGQAFAGLDAHELVLGPARDGGYYLLGMKRMHEAPFHDLPWSTPRLLELTLDRLREVGIEPVLLPPLGDVDVAADLPAGWREWAATETP